MPRIHAEKYSMTSVDDSTICAADSHLCELLQFAEGLARQAGPLSLQYFRQSPDSATSLVVENKLADGRFDPVTLADRQIEQSLRAEIEKHYPDHSILGEEFGRREGSSEWRWVLDPIDGTRAYITGMPLWGILIALALRDKPLLGIIEQPFLRERYIGGPGAAVCRNTAGDRLLRSSDCAALEDAILMTTDPSMFSSANEIAAYQQLQRRVRLSRFGGDCYAYCLLASGFVDLVVEADLEPYDVQALIPLVTAAGGVITDWSGGSAANGGQVLAAATPSLHQAALRVLENGAN